MSEVSDDGKKQVKQWLLEASQAAEAFDGSEASEKRLFGPLSLFEDFVRAHDDNGSASEREQRVANIAFPDHPVNMPTTVDGFLDVASEFYEHLASRSQESSDISSILEKSGAVVKQTDQIFVKTDDQEMSESSAPQTKPYEIRTEPRLAMLIAHLRNDGVIGQSIYMDDLVITRGDVDENMMRKHPYSVVQIPRLDIEIAVCDQIGETTFVKKGTVGSEFWSHLSKEQLKERDDVVSIDRHNDGQWWGDISEFLSIHAESDASKINVKTWSNRRPKLDMQLVKISIAEHRLQTGEWLSYRKIGQNNKPGTFVLEHGPYTGLINARNLNNALYIGLHGLPGGSSIAKLNKEVSEELGLDYVNKRDMDDLDIELVKEGLLMHRLETGKWLNKALSSPDGKRGSFVLEYGAYAGQMTAGGLDSILAQGGRGLPGGTSIAKLNQEISDKYDLDYTNKQEKEDMEIGLIKEGLLEHYLETGEWLTTNKRETPDSKDGSFILRHGEYAGEITVGGLNTNLAHGLRGLPGGDSVSKLNKELKAELEQGLLVPAGSEEHDTQPTAE